MSIETDPALTKSLEQDLSLLPQMLQNRIVMIGADFELTHDRMNPESIAALLGTYRRQVLKIARDVGLIEDPELASNIDKGSMEGLTFPGYAFSIIKEEYDWLNEYRKLDKHMSIGEIAKFSARSYGWTRNYIQENRPRRIRGNNKSAYLYHRGVLKDIRIINIEVPLDGDWLTIGAITERVAHDREWIENRIEELGVSCEERRSVLTGRVFDHYPSGIIDKFIEIDENGPVMAGDWTTVERISTAIPGHSYKWVQSRLEEYKQFAEIRIDDQGVSRTHFPPSVFREVMKEDEKLKNTPFSGEYITLTELARSIGKSRGWTTKRLAKTALSKEVRLDKKGRPGLHYSPDSVEKLQAIRQSEEDN